MKYIEALSGLLVRQLIRPGRGGIVRPRWGLLAPSSLPGMRRRPTATGAVVVAPVLESISRDIGIAAGGTKQTLRGYNFSSGTIAVTFHGVAATSIVIVNDNKLTCLTPAGTASETGVDVVVSNSAGTSTLSAAFEYGAVTTTTYASETFAGGTLGAFSAEGDTAPTVVTIPSPRGTATKAVLCTTSVSTHGSSIGLSTPNNPALNQPGGLWVDYFEYMPSATVTLLSAGQIKHFLGRPSAGGSSPSTMMTGTGPEFSGAQKQLVSRIDAGIVAFLGSNNGALMGDAQWQRITMQLTRNSGASTGRCRGWRNGKFVFSVTSANIGSNGATDSELWDFGLVYTQNAAAGTLQVYITDAQISNGYLEPLDS